MSTLRRRLMRVQADLAIVCALALAAVASVVLDLAPFVRIFLIVPLVVILPGYALVQAVLPRGRLPIVEVAVMSVGASLAIAVLAGLFTAVTPAGLDALSWTVALASITLCGALVGWIRRRRAPGDPGKPRRPLPAVRRGDAVLLAIAGVLVVGAIVGTRVITAAQEPTAPAYLWMLPASDQGTTVRVGVKAGPKGGNYTVRVSLAGDTVKEFKIQLVAEQEWEATVDLPADSLEQPVARLLQTGTNNELRIVFLAAPTHVP